MASKEFEKLMAYMAANPMPKVSREKTRENMSTFGANAQLPENVTSQDPSDAPVRTRLFAPDKAGPGLILFAHGGGFTLGSIESHMHVAAWLAHYAGMPVVIFDYSLAPEAPFPAALEDFRAMFEWALGKGHAASSLGLAGDSAGANLGVSLAANGYVERPGAIAALSPSFNLAGYLAIDPEENPDKSFSADEIAEGFRLYLGSTAPDDPRASPNFADLSKLPPTLVQFATEEVFAPGARDLAEKAKAAGAEIEIDEWPEMTHDWHWFAPRLPEAREALERAGTFLAQNLK